MLPIYPDVEAGFKAVFTLKFTNKVEEYATIPIFSAPFVNYEGGEKVVYISGDGQETLIEFQEISGKEIISYGDNTPNGEHRNVMEALDSMAMQMANQRDNLFLDTLLQASDESGTVIKSENRPFPEFLLEMIEKMDISFDEDGNSIKLIIIVNPEDLEELKKWERDDDLMKKCKEKFIRIIDKKRKDWNERENNRKLVD